MPAYKEFLLALFLISSSLATAKTFYVSTIGEDSNPGTISQPWQNWSKAFRTAQPGDTVYFRGGIYPSNSTNGFGVYYNPSASVGYDGTKDNPIIYMAYPPDFEAGNYPILDCSNNVSIDFFFHRGLYIKNVDYVKFIGLTVRNVFEKAGAGVEIAWDLEYSNNVTVERCTIYNVGGVCFRSLNSDTITFYNCDAYNACDTLGNNPGNYGTGFNAQGVNTSGLVTFYGCRAWWCSDQGFSSPAAQKVVFDHCWSFNNSGLYTGDGHGFKIGYNASNYPAMLREVKNCLAFCNATDGYTTNENDENPMGYYAYFSNNIAYDNVRFGFVTYVATPPGTRVFTNNISYANGTNTYFYGTVNTYITNSWDISPFPVSNSDFLSIDTTGVTGPRQIDGSLPDLDFLKLMSTSDLIDLGTDVGLPYNGSAPDLGWSEYSSASAAPFVPIYLSSVVENATPFKLNITYNLTLANIVPAVSAFAVRVNSSARAVSSVAISGTKVILTLSSPVVYGDIVTVAYTKPATNPLQTAASGQAASITSQNVTNNVGAASPVYVISVVENATPSRLEMTYNLTLANIVPAISAFVVQVNSSARAVSSVAISGANVLLTLASPAVYGDVVTVAYTKPVSNPIQTTTGGQAASMTAQNVINNVAAANQPPAVNISSPTKSTSFIAPATITIDANASDPDGSIAKVEFFNGNVRLGEITSATYHYTWKGVPAGTYSITAAATDNKGLRTVSTAVSVVVEKSAAAINQLPSVTIKTPNTKKPKKHDNIVIVAEASDPDGTISKVELKNGNTTIAELTTAPYTFTIQDVDTGSYVITATATDNLGAVSTSEAIEISVEDFFNPDLISLYPNPNNGFFKIDILEEIPDQKCTLSIVTLTGTTVYQDEVNLGEISKEIRLPDLQSGPYVLMLTNGKTILTTKKFIKQ